MNSVKNIKIVIGVAVIVLVISGYVFKNRLPDTKEQRVVTQNPPTINFEIKTTPTFKTITKEEYLHYYNFAKPTLEITNTHRQCWEKNDDTLCREGYILSKNPNVIRINKNCLEITLQDKNKKRICNTKEQHPDNWSGEIYTFLGHVPSMGYLFEIAIWEGRGKLLVDETTGKELPISGEPIPSPSGNRFLTIGSDPDHGQNGFEVWQKEGGSYAKKLDKLTLDSYDEEITNPLWVGENSFYFIKRFPNAEPGTSPDQYGAFSF
ncbi:MAG: hypothetical protein AAB552_00700 [Patescibacteria group bacterium]